jgi:hypothetical protein
VTLDKRTINKVYGKGFVDGMERAFEMNDARIEELERGQTSVARKVLELVPIQEFWPASQIHTEAIRKGISIDKSKVEGCLNSLKQSGLVKEKAGTFTRVAARPRALLPERIVAQPVQFATPPITTAGSAPEAIDPLDRIATVAAAIRAQANTIAKLADAVDTIALDVDAHIKSISQSSEKLRQLRELLGVTQ